MRRHLRRHPRRLRPRSPIPPSRSTACSPSTARRSSPAAWTSIRRVYPGLSPAQSQEWEEFFRGVRDIDVELEVTGLQVSGDSAAAQLAGVYVFEDPGTHRTRRENVAFQAQLRREGGRWRIASLR